MNKRTSKNLIQAFYSYIVNYRKRGRSLCQPLQEKLEHIKRVAANAFYIAKEEGWSESDRLIAELCGYFHDIGRFSQYKQYQTFSDEKSVNHGKEGFNLIKRGSFLKGLDSKEAEIILNSVLFHNTLTIPRELNKEYIPFIELVRDSDKIDILFTLTETIKNKTLNSHKDLLWDLPMGNANPSIIEKVLKNQTALYSDIKSGTDVCLLQLGWLYDINYKASIQLLSERNTLDLIASILPKTEEIKIVLEHIRKFTLT